jgi:hypothetical protein
MNQQAVASLNPGSEHASWESAASEANRGL